LAAQGPETGTGLGEGLLNCAKKSETYFLFDESEPGDASLAREEASTAASTKKALEPTSS
ncbi:hypothetical protein, partial [Pseudomonas syringae]|uniref:hypothetical protein n=1 Tax=Pseudomonas syringae TaxID=317 RepID=UPI00051651A5